VPAAVALNTCHSDELSAGVALLEMMTSVKHGRTVLPVVTITAVVEAAPVMDR
jgi:hypothetical protein